MPHELSAEFAADFPRITRFDNPVNKADTFGFNCIDRAAGHDELHRLRGSNEAWQTLRAAVTWHKTQFDFRQTHFGVGGRNAKCACHREFQSTPKRIALYYCN